jgi:hypothetical protein
MYQKPDSRKEPKPSKRPPPQKVQAIVKDVTKVEDAAQETIIIEDPHAYSNEPELDETQDDSWESRKASRTSRLRASAYKTRGSVVRNLHEHENHQRYQPETRQNTQTHSPKVRLPRLKAKPRMDIYIPSTVAVGRLAKILDVKLSMNLSFLPSSC